MLMAEQMGAHDGVNAVRPDQQVAFGEGTILKLGAHHAAATCAAINAKIPEEDIVRDPANPIGSARALLDAIFTHTDGYKRFRKTAPASRRVLAVDRELLPISRRRNHPVGVLDLS
jgi:hypothetical protein